MTFSQLSSFLTEPLTAPPEGDEPVPAPDHIPEPRADVGTLLSKANWVIFAMLDMNTQRFEAAGAVRVFLDLRSQRDDKRIVVLALNTPYRLDSTEIGKLSAYYVAYSKTPAFIEAAVRSLFGDLTPTGAPPVAIEGIGYDLTNQLSPDPHQSIPLRLLEPPDPAVVTPCPTNVRLVAGPTLDPNPHPVPDGKRVAFWFRHKDGSLLDHQIAVTVEGTAEATFYVKEGGLVLVSADSGQASTSLPTHLAFQPPTPTITPSPIPTPTATTTATPKPEATIAATKESTATAGPAISPSPTPPPPPPPRPDPSAFLLTLISIGLVSTVEVLLGRRYGLSMAELTQVTLLTLVAGLAGYMVYALGWRWLAPKKEPSFWAAGMALVFAACPLAWMAIRNKNQ